jgi:predicted membrane channel-forming protein YqfA (hemolysin III family)
MRTLVQLLQECNIRPYMTLYICIIHLLAIIGMVCSLLTPQTFFRVLRVII